MADGGWLMVTSLLLRDRVVLAADGSALPPFTGP
jgi:hypothetical protein